MGLHTWCYKNRDLYEKQQALFDKLDKFYNGEVYYDELELGQIENEADEIGKENDTEFHDVFRTNKREPDGTYTLDVIYSRKECYEWLKENADKVYNRMDEYLDRFWNKYPDGVIDFG